MVVTQSASGLRKSDRFWLQRSALLLALIPLAIVAYRLADLPGPPLYSQFSDDGTLLLTRNSPIGGRALDQKVDYCVLSLESGKTLRVSAAEGQMFGNDCAFFVREHNQSFRLMTLDRDSFQLQDRGIVTIDAEDLIAFLPGSHFAKIRAKQELIVTDLQTGTVAKAQLPALRGARLDIWRVHSMATPFRWLVSEFSNRRTGGKEKQLLFAFDNGELKQLAEWASTNTSLIQGDNLISWTVDHVLEIRRLADGTLVESHPLESELGILPGTVTYADVVGDTGQVRIWTGTAGQSVIYDFQHRRVVARFANASEPLQEVLGGSALFLNQKTQELVVRRVSDQSLLRKWEFHQQIRDSKFMDNGLRVAVLFSDGSVRTYDVATGDCLRAFRDRPWVVPTFAALLLGFGAWSWTWVKQRLRHGSSPVWDVVVIHFAILGGLLMRVFLHSAVGSPFHPVLVGCEALAIGWGTFAMGWSFFGHGRWSLRAVGPFIAGAAGLSVGIAIFRHMPEGIVGFAVALIAITSLVGLLFWLLRRWGWRVLPSTELQRLVTSSADRIRLPLRDLFSLTFGVAVLLAVTRFVPFARLPLEIVETLFMIAAAAATTAVVAWWGSLGTWHWFLRAAAVFLVAVAASLLISTGRTWTAWREVASLTFAVAAIVWFSCWMFRLRGWRFVRVARGTALAAGFERKTEG